MTSRFHFLACLLLSAGCAAVAQPDPGLDIQLPATGASSLTINDHGNSGRVTFRHSVDGYEVSCDGRALAVWGKPLKMNANNPQDSDLTIVDLPSLKTTRQFAFSKGVFSVEFLKDKPQLLVDTDPGEVVDFQSGKSLPPPPDQNFDEAAFPRESCDDFKSKSYRRYRE
jgi:hypothetical protein